MVGLTDHLTTRLGRVPSGSIGWDIPSGGQKHGQVVCTLREQHSIGNRIQIEKRIRSAADGVDKEFSHATRHGRDRRSKWVEQPKHAAAFVAYHSR